VLITRDGGIENTGGKPWSQPEVYEIRFKGHLDVHRAQMFEGLEMVQGPGGETVLTGPSAGEGVQNGFVTWEISVTDDQAAEAQLLGYVLAGEALTVVEFSHKKHELEEIFLSLVEGGTDGR
jgi:hypothetical protein